jgi:hypothetical protein
MGTVRNRFQAFREFASRAILALAVTALSFVWVSCASIANGAKTQDGFYLLSDDTSLPLVNDQDGNAIRLGARQDVNVHDAKIVSQNNVNSQFNVNLTILKYTEQQVGALVVSGKVYARGGARNQDFSFTFLGAENVTNIARFLNVPVTYKKHPGYNLAVSFSPTKPTFAVGEQVKVTMLLQNVGTTPFRFLYGGRNRGPRDDNYTFQAWLGDDQVAQIGKDTNLGGPVSLCLLKPGESITNGLVLNDWFAFDKPAAYNMRGSYLMVFCQTDDPTPSRPMTILWDDFATGYFSVKIVPAQPH